MKRWSTLDSTGVFILPISVRSGIDAPFERVPLTIADDYVYDVEAWEAVLELEERSFPVTARAFGREYIIGREILDQMEVCFEFGQRVRLRFE